ncbi:MAG: M48 family metallopeptidase [Lachnospiraceae bacterium]
MMWLRKCKAKKWTQKIINQNMSVTTPIDCEQYIHSLDKSTLEALKKIPLLDTICSKLLSIMNDKQNTIINMSSKIHITENQFPKIYLMVQSICNKIGIEMPELYLELNREPNAYTYGTEKFTIIIHSGLLECFEDDELYAVLAHECGHIACKHGLYHTIGGMVLTGGVFGLHELGSYLNGKGLWGSVASSIVSTVDSALELAFFHWYRCSEFSADRVAVICCGSAEPVIETMMRLAGGTMHFDEQLNKDLFLSQAIEYRDSMEKDAINKGLEFLLTKNDTHPLLAVRAYEAQAFANSEEFKNIGVI